MGKSAVDLARELLSHFGNLTGLVAAGEAEFCTTKGWGRLSTCSCRPYWKCLGAQRQRTFDPSRG
ncbi:MAG TPA: hypothetical protein VGD24_06285 [Gallionella sp.]